MRPRPHPQDFRGILQADGYAGFNRLYNDPDRNHPIREAASWANVRRKFYDIHVARQSPVAAEALARIGDVYGIEEQIPDQAVEVRQQIRQARAGPLIAELSRILSGHTKRIVCCLSLVLHYPLTWRARWSYITYRLSTFGIDND